MALAVEQDETPNPARIRLLRADAVMRQADLAAHLVRQLGRRAGRCVCCFHWGGSAEGVDKQGDGGVKSKLYASAV